MNGILDLKLIGRLVLAALLGFIISFERERARRPAGQRTHALVALGAATFAITRLRYIVREVYHSFAALAGLPEDASPQIEDLADLQRLNITITELADRQQSLETRQGAIETSQDQARQAWRDLRTEIRTIASRVAAMEQRVGDVISREQRGYLYQLVQAWGAAKATRDVALLKASLMLPAGRC